MRSKTRTRLLLGASTALLATLGAAAKAQTVTVDDNIAATVDGQLISDQYNDKNVGANASSDVAPVLGAVDTSAYGTDANKTGASATGNVDTLSYSDLGSAGTNTPVVAAAYQENNGNTVSANSSGADFTLSTGTADDSALTVKGNIGTTSATGNTLTQAIALESANATIGNTSASADITGAVTITGGVVVSSRQINDGASVDANSLNADVTITTDNATGSSLGVTGNIETSTITGSTATNSISGSGANSSTGVVVAGYQQNFESTLSSEVGSNSFRIDADAVEDSALTLKGNLATSGTTGQTLTQTIALDAANLTPGSTAASADIGTNVSSDGAVLVASRQINDTATITADTGGNTMVVDTGNATDSSLGLSGNIQSATVNGSVVANTITASAANNTAGVVGAVYQGATDSTISAETTNAYYAVSTGVTQTSTLTLQGNVNTSAATINTATQKLTLDGANLNLAAVSAGADTDTDLGTTGAAILASRQMNTATTVEANTTGSTYNLNTGNTSGSSLALSGNTDNSLATGSAAANTITATGTNVGTGIVVASQQENDLDSTVTALTSASANLSTGSLSDSSALLNGNKLQSQAIGVTAANTLTVAAANVTLAGADVVAGATIDAGLPTVSAAYATLNDQLVSGDVSATSNSEADVYAIYNYADDAVSGSTIATDGNAITAKAQGALATNVASVTVSAQLDGGTAADDGVANGVAVANSQVVDNNADVLATVASGGTDLVRLISTELNYTLDDSTVSTSNNVLQATAEATNATNTLAVSGANLATPADGTGYAVGSYSSAAGASVDSAFALANVQSTGTADVTATVGDVSQIRTYVDYDVDSSSIMSNGNQFAGYATANKAANALTLSGTNVAADAGLINAQTSGSDVSALLGDTSTIGATIEINDAIYDSSLAVNGNSAIASAVNNTATNTLAATATNLDGTGTDGRAYIEPGSSSLYAEADYVVGNQQTFSSTASSKSWIDTAYGIDQTFGYTADDSRLSVSNNTQFGEALANSATNKLTLTATDVGAGLTPTAALSNAQMGNGGSVETDSYLTLYTNAASSDSAIAINGNTNTALGVINNASNTLAVTGTNLSYGFNSKGYIDYDANEVSADYALSNVQNASGTLDSNAYTSVYNNDRTDTASMGMADSTATYNANVTTAEASANRVANQLTVAGAANNGATAALANSQTNSAGVQSWAETDIAHTLTADVDYYGANASQVSIDGNTTTSLARGNTANNTLSYTAGAVFGAQDGTSSTTGTDDVSATAGLLNAQTNSGGVTANAYSASYQITLNIGDGEGAALNGAASVSNNSVAAAAYGNSAINNLTMATFASGVPSSAVSNVQYNTGAVTANAEGATFGVTFSGSSAGTAIRNTGNTVTAQAVGNSSISTISGS